MDRVEGFKHIGKTDDTCRQSRVYSDLQLRKSRRIDQVRAHRLFVSRRATDNQGTFMHSLVNLIQSFDDYH